MRIPPMVIAGSTLGAAAVGTGVLAVRDSNRQTDGADPTEGRVHVLGKPVLVTALATGATVGAAGGLGSASFVNGMRSRTTSPKVAVAAAVGGALAGVTLTTAFGTGPTVGTVAGKNSHFVKTGTKTYQTTCQGTVTDPSTGKSFSHTYPCTKVQNVGRHVWGNAIGELRLGRHMGDADGYANVEDAVAAVKSPGERAPIAFVQRDGRVHAYALETSGLERRETVNPTHESIVAFTDLDDTLHIGPRD